MYCIFCGTKNPDKAKFCVACGQNLAKALQETKPPVKPAIPESTVLGITREDAKNQAMSAQIHGFFNGNPAGNPLPQAADRSVHGDALSRWESVKARKGMLETQTANQDAADKNTAVSLPNSAPAPVQEEKVPEPPAPVSEPNPERKERPVTEAATEMPSPHDRSLSQPVAAPTEGIPQKGLVPAAPAAVDAPAAVSRDKRQPTEPTDGLERQEPEAAGPNLHAQKAEDVGEKSTELPDTSEDYQNRKSEDRPIFHDTKVKAEPASKPENVPAHSISAEKKKSKLPAKAKNLFTQLKNARSKRKAVLETPKQEPAKTNEADLDADYEADFADVPVGRVKMVKRSKESVKEIRRNILILIAISIPLIVGSIFLIMK